MFERGKTQCLALTVDIRVDDGDVVLSIVVQVRDEGLHISRRERIVVAREHAVEIVDVEIGLSQHKSPIPSTSRDNREKVRDHLLFHIHSNGMPASRYPFTTPRLTDTF